MPKVKVEKQTIVVARPGLHLVYQPGECVAPDAHIEEIVRQGNGVRLTSRGDALRFEPPIAAAAPEPTR
jgi:hypothetical protein